VPIEKKEAIKAAKECFDANKEMDKLFVAIDGQCFTNEHAALQHSRSKDKKETEVVCVQRNEKAEESEFDKYTVASLKEELTAKGIAFEPNAKKQQLYDLLIANSEKGNDEDPA
jgi:hypothetical protein